MRALLTFVGGRGHLEPLLPVVRALRRAGHEVAVAGSGRPLERLGGSADGTGLTTFSTSLPRPTADPPAVRDRTPVVPTDAAAAEEEFAENFGERATRRHLPAVGEVIGRWRPDVVVRDETDFGSAIAAELAGVPCATVLVLAAGTLIRPGLVGPRLEQIREEVGLAPDPVLATGLRGPALSPFPPTFRDPSAPALPPGSVSFRPGPLATPAATAGRPLVYVTLGTVFNLESGELFERLLAGVGGVGADVVLTVGDNLDPDELGPHPAHVRVERYVPQEEVLGHSRLMVSHGGSGSLMGALSHGVPSVLLPLGADQPHNARRAVALGVAHVLDAATVTAQEISREVTRMLDDGPTRDAAAAVAAEIAGLPGPEVVVPGIARLAGH